MWEAANDKDAVASFQARFDQRQAQALEDLRKATAFFLITIEKVDDENFNTTTYTVINTDPEDTNAVATAIITEGGDALARLLFGQAL